ncbi:DUF4179 domain-containing protein [Paenibacillus paeoniae]|uniref:DUF4179 domain-containing protein n=1 Tax=Paenibacillus paeoniae TaxID=2292705 RepID=A0A371PHK4_9BACL|nr:DUF4179 domain-containing protein [Paenibacillus paeoniae]REK75106.1 DUF4179 domain-containing protein [Paenibacillus paeoniae]
MSGGFHTDELELKKRFNETRLPHIHLEARVLAQTGETTIENKKKPIYRNRLLAAVYSFIAAALLLGGLSIFPASAEHIRKLPGVGKLFEGNIFSFAGDTGIASSPDAGLINKEASDQGVTIKLQDVIYDGARLSIGYEIHAEQPDNLMFLGEVAVAINGVRHSEITYSAKPHRINANQSIGIMTFDIGDDTEPMDSFEMDLTIREVTGFKSEYSAEQNGVAGEWNFSFAVTNHESEDSRYHSLADGFTAASKNRKLQLTGYLLTAQTTKLDFRMVGSTNGLDFQLRDDQGMLIEKLDTRFRTDNNGMTSGTVRFVPLPNGTKEVSITPYISLAGKGDSKKISENVSDSFPIVLSQGDIGEVMVKDIIFHNDKTLIYYEVKGKDPYNQLTSLWLETADGERIIIDNGKRSRISDNTYDYVLEYPALDSHKQYVAATMTREDIQLLDELTVKLMINE